MRCFQYLLLAVVCCLLVGCGATTPAAPAMTDDVRAAVAAEDAKVRSEESKH
jgi:outer membrane biogenesis lipoprotein LolB